MPYQYVREPFTIDEADRLSNACETTPKLSSLLDGRALFSAPLLSEPRIVRSCQEKIRITEQKLASIASHPRLGEYKRIYFQMLGACDQVADAARRLPLEAGVLYDEDHERFEQAVQAFDRVNRLWEASGA
jgi:hypothetical protein